MDTWDMLGIEPTIDMSVIKKAYAKKLKIYHPEDDPHGYQLLREAYDDALKYAKNKEFDESEDTIFINNENDSLQDNIPQQLLIEEHDNTHKYDELRPPIISIIDDTVDLKVNYEQLITKFFEDTNTLYNSFFDRLEKRNWGELLNSEIMWQLDYQQIMNKKMLEFLVDHHYFPKDIWQLLNDSFHWNEQKDYLESSYPAAFVKYLFKQIGRDIVPRYCYFKNNIGINFDEYLNYREEAFVALYDNDLKKAKYNIFQALEIYPKDPDLLCMHGEYNIRMSDKKMAYKAFKAAIKINSNDNYVYFYQAQIMLNYNESKSAVKICKTLLGRENDNQFEIRTLLGKCYIGLENYHKASQLFLDNYKINPSDVETKKYLVRLANKLSKEYKCKMYPYKLRLKKDLKKVYYILGDNNGLEEIQGTYKQDILFYIFISLTVICIIVWVSYSNYTILALVLAQIIYFTFKKILK